ARLQLADAYYNAGDFKNAILKYTEFLQIYPNAEEAASVQTRLQTSYVKSGMPEEQIAKLTQGQAKAEVIGNVWWDKGAKAYNYKDSKTAPGYFKKILIDFPASSIAANAAFYRGECLFLQEKYEEAASAYKNFLAQFPNDSQATTAMFRLGVSLFNTN